MTATTAILLLLLTACAAQPPQPAGVCAFSSRDGAATAMGVATIALPVGDKGSAVNVPAAIAGTGPTSTPAVFILIAPKTGPEDALFGWAITQNETAQTLFAWTNDAAGTPVCNTGSVALPSYYVPGFSICGGDAESALWPSPNGAYALGHMRVLQFATPQSNGARPRRLPPPPSRRLRDPLTPPPPAPHARAATAAAFTEDGALVAVRADNSPFGNGAFSIQFNGGGGPGINSGWRVPSWCAAA